MYINLNKQIKHAKFLNNLFLNKYNIHYLAIPKCANTTLKICILCSLEILDIEKEKQILKCPELIHKISRQYIIDHKVIKKNLIEFAIIRDPIDRFKSFYKDKILGSGWSPKIKKEFIETYNLSTNNNIDEDIEKLCMIPDSRSEIHFRSQYYIINQSKLTKNPKIFNIDNFDFVKNFLYSIITDKHNKVLKNLYNFQKSKNIQLNLSNKSISFLKSRYIEDYEMINSVK